MSLFCQVFRVVVCLQLLQLLYLKINSCKAEKNEAFKGFKEARNKFDKALRKAGQQYNRNFIDSIETFSSKNPKEFWKHIKKLGPRNKTEIPMQVKVDDTYSSEIDTVLHKWENDFSGLYNKPQLTNDNANFHDEILKQKQVLENSNYYLPPAAEGRGRGEIIKRLPYMRACVRESIRSSRFYINLNISFIYKNIFTKFAGNVYGFENLSVQNFSLILKNKMATIANCLKIIKVL